VNAAVPVRSKSLVYGIDRFPHRRIWNLIVRSRPDAGAHTRGIGTGGNSRRKLVLRPKIHSNFLTRFHDRCFSPLRVAQRKGALTQSRASALFFCRGTFRLGAYHIPKYCAAMQRMDCTASGPHSARTRSSAFVTSVLPDTAAVMRNESGWPRSETVGSATERGSQRGISTKRNSDEEPSLAAMKM
jgi:hypothetical protein